MNGQLLREKKNCDLCGKEGKIGVWNKAPTPAVYVWNKKKVCFHCAVKNRVI